MSESISKTDFRNLFTKTKFSCPGGLAENNSKICLLGVGLHTSYTLGEGELFQTTVTQESLSLDPVTPSSRSKDRPLVLCGDIEFTKINQVFTK